MFVGDATYSPRTEGPESSARVETGREEGLEKLDLHPRSEEPPGGDRAKTLTASPWRAKTSGGQGEEAGDECRQHCEWLEDPGFGEGVKDRRDVSRRPRDASQ